jgi:hypothetical protein
VRLCSSFGTVFGSPTWLCARSENEYAIVQRVYLCSGFICSYADEFVLSCSYADEFVLSLLDRNASPKCNPDYFVPAQNGSHCNHHRVTVCADVSADVCANA